MSDIDALVKAAEGRIAKSGRSALARMHAEKRLSRLVEATADAARSRQASPSRSRAWKWIVIGGPAVLAGALFTSVLTRTSPPAASLAPAPMAIESPSSSARTVAVDTLPNAPEEALPSVAESSTAVRPEPAPIVRVAPSAKLTAQPRMPENRLPEDTEAAPPSIVSESAAELFERANNTRRAGDYASAETLYRRLLDQYPRSREAATTQIVLGRMLLSRGEIDAALTLFDGYLAEWPRAALAEQALVGRAQCLQRQKRREEERAAWRLLLETFPGSPNRAEALERLR